MLSQPSTGIFASALSKRFKESQIALSYHDPAHECHEATYHAYHSGLAAGVLVKLPRTLETLLSEDPNKVVTELLGSIERRLKSERDKRVQELNDETATVVPQWTCDPESCDSTAHVGTNLSTLDKHTISTEEQKAQYIDDNFLIFEDLAPYIYGKNAAALQVTLDSFPEVFGESRQSFIDKYSRLQHDREGPQSHNRTVFSSADPYKTFGSGLD